MEFLMEVQDKLLTIDNLHKGSIVFLIPVFSVTIIEKQLLDLICLVVWKFGY